MEDYFESSWRIVQFSHEIVKRNLSRWVFRRFFVLSQVLCCIDNAFWRNKEGRKRRRTGDHLLHNKELSCHEILQGPGLLFFSKLHASLRRIETIVLFNAIDHEHIPWKTMHHSSVLVLSSRYCRFEGWYHSSTIRGQEDGIILTRLT